MTFPPHQVGSPAPENSGRPVVYRRAFTLIEMLMVITIIAILVGIALPHLGGLKNSNAILSASRQLQDDLHLARLLAINNRAPVYVVMLPQMSDLLAMNPGMNTNMFATNLTANNLLDRQGLAYALYTEHSVGDQPGSYYPRYLTEWRTLPEGVFISPATMTGATNNSFQFNHRFLFPSVNYPTAVTLPYLAFAPNGRLQNQTFDAIIALDRGAAFPMLRNPSGFYPVQNLEMIEKPPGNWTNNYNRVVVNWLTGRTRMDRFEIQQ